MISKRKYIVITLFVVTFRPVDLQYPYLPPMFPMPPPPIPVPVPVPGPVQVAVLPIPYPVTEETTTCKPTTKKSDSHWPDDGGNGRMAIAFPVPVPMPLMPPPMPLPMPPPMPPPPCMKNRPCPPPPMPFPPLPMPGPAFPLPIGPAPAIMFPLPRFPKTKKDKCKKKKNKDSDCCSSSDSDSSSDCTSKERRCRRAGDDHDHDHNHYHHHRPMRKFNRRRGRRNGRKFARGIRSDNDLKPMLSYISKHGNVKLTKRLTEDDAEKLLNADSKSEDLSEDPTMEVFSRKNPRVVVMSDKEGQSSFDKRNNRRVMLRGIDDTLFLNQGRKELVFRPRSNKAISNLSVSFLVN